MVEKALEERLKFLGKEINNLDSLKEAFFEIENLKDGLGNFLLNNNIGYLLIGIKNCNLELSERKFYFNKYCVFLEAKYKSSFQ